MAERYIFIGGVWLDKDENRIIEKSKGNVQSAANVLETELISGLELVTGIDITIVNELFVGSFPKFYKDMFIHSGIFNHSNSPDHIDYNIGFCNLPYIKHFFRYEKSKKVLRKIKNAWGKDTIFVIGYSMSSSIVKGMLYMKKISPNVKTCLIVPDLPEFMNTSTKKGLLKLLKSFNKRDLYQKIRGIDSFVVLTEHMYSALNVEKPYVVVEGIAHSEAISNTDEIENKDSIKNVLYTGSLSSRYGIRDLVDSFCLIRKDDIRLTICGYGDCADYIKEKAQSDSRIHFLGIVENKKARALQRKAYILVNPRKPDQIFTKYSFPSKTMEYLAAGRPLVMYKLAGIPEEYNDHIFWVDDNLKDTLEYVLSLPEETVNSKAKAAQQFVLESKNKCAQAKKIVELIKQIP